MTHTQPMAEWEPSSFPTAIAFDPGGVTGWSVITVHPASLVDPEVAILDNILHWDQGQLTGDEHEQVDAILEMLDLWDGAAAVFEDFHLRTLAAELSPVTITHTVSWVLSRQFDPARSMFLQMPSMAMSTATNERLNRWKLYRRDGQEHARDATRHAVTFLRRTKQQATLRLAAFGDLVE